MKFLMQENYLYSLSLMICIGKGEISAYKD